MCAVAGIRRLREAGVPVEINYSPTRFNVHDIAAAVVFDNKYLTLPRNCPVLEFVLPFMDHLEPTLSRKRLLRLGSCALSGRRCL